MNIEILDLSNPFLLYAVDQICAVCLKALDEEHVLTESVPNSTPPCLLVDVLKSISQFSMEDGPEMVCSACFKNINAAYRFQSMCNKAQEYYDNFKQLDPHSKVDFAKLLAKEDDTPVKKSVKKPRPPRKRVAKYKMEECPVCHKMLVASYVKQHLLTHTGERPHQCEICKKSFAEKPTLRKHMLFHNNIRNFVCNYCGQAFHLGGTLRAHIRIHTGERPFKCKVCSKGFRLQTALKKHSRIHTGERPFQCEYCAKTFAQRSNLVLHHKTHTNDRPHVCSVCGKAFIQRQNLLGHMRTHTKKDTREIGLQLVDNATQIDEEEVNEALIGEYVEFLT